MVDYPFKQVFGDIFSLHFIALAAAYDFKDDNPIAIGINLFR